MTGSRLACLALASLLLAFGSSGARADPIAIGEEHCVVNVASTDALNMRQGPGSGYFIVTQKPYGSCGIIVGGACTANWCPVNDGHFEGWVSRRYIAMVSPAMYCVAGVGWNDALNVRAYPSASSRILVQLPPNQCEIAFLPYPAGNWQKIRVAGWEGWAARRFLSGQ